MAMTAAQINAFKTASGNIDISVLYLVSVGLLLCVLLAQYDGIVPIPGTKKVERLDENLATTELVFSQSELEDIRKTLDRFAIVGERYPES